MTSPFKLPPHLVELDAQAIHVRTAFDRAAGPEAGSMAWRIWGEGEPLLLVHGSHGSWLHWMKNIPVLARHRKLIVPDLPGYGDSDVIHPVNDVDAHARAVVEGMRQILPDHVPAGERIDVAAFSAGSLIMSRAEAMAPDIVQRLVLISASGLDTPARPPEFQSVRGLTGEAMREANRYNLAVLMIHDPARIDDDMITMSILGGRRMRSMTALEVMPDRLIRAIEHVGAPIDLIWGDSEFAHPDPDCQLAALQRLQPDARMRVISQCGHWAMGEQPDAFNRTLLEVLALPLRPRLEVG